MTMTMQDILVFQTNWPNNIDIMYSEKRGMTRAFVYLMKDGELHRLLLTTKAFPTKDECRYELGEFIERILNTKI